MLTSSIDADFAVRAIQARTDAAGDPVDDLSGEADRLVHALLTQGQVRPTTGYRLTPAGGMNLTLGSGDAKTDVYCVVGTAAGQLPYLVRLESANVAIAVPAADATQQRTDEVWLVVHDAAYDAGGVSLARIGYRTGTPGGGPPGPDPSWKAAAPLHNVVVPAAATEIVAGNIVNRRVRSGLIPELLGQVPVGAIVMWSGAVVDIPHGWRLCDGAGGTPDLRGRFVAGAGGSYEVGATGGTNSVNITVNQLPAHNHAVPSHNHAVNNHNHGGATTGQGEHTHGVRHAEPPSEGNGGFFKGAAGLGQTATLGVSGAHNHTIPTQSGLETGGSGTLTSNNTGSGNAVENRPPYYALAYIQRIG